MAVLNASLALARSPTILLNALANSPISSPELLTTRCVRSPSPTLLAASRSAKTGTEILRANQSPIIMPITRNTLLATREVARIFFLPSLIASVVRPNSIAPDNIFVANGDRFLITEFSESSGAFIGFSGNDFKSESFSENC